MTDSHASGPNPLCEVGRRHPRDKHRMRPVEGHENTWQCSRHGMFATLVDKTTADSFERGDSYPTPDGADGLIVGTGDERPGGIILYYRAK
jgi:hypothetical protein